MPFRVFTFIFPLASLVRNLQHATAWFQLLCYLSSLGAAHRSHSTAAALHPGTYSLPIRSLTAGCALLQIHCTSTLRGIP